MWQGLPLAGQWLMAPTHLRRLIMIFRCLIEHTIFVYTMSVRNITFSADENKIDRAREVARGEHKTLNDAFREWLDWYASRNINREEVEALFKKLKYVNAGRKFTRDEMNER
jgi:hypothetical protein